MKLRSRRFVVYAPTVAVAVVLLLVLSFVSATGLVAAASGSGNVGPTTALSAPAPSPVTGHPVPSGGGAPSSGRGVFWNNTPIAQAPLANRMCQYWAYYIPGSFCTNDTMSPSIASTSSGDMLTAMTSFSNVSACPGDANLTLSEVAVAVSSNAGSSFGAPTYFSNPGCVDSFNYTSAMWPVVTALANGTFVMAYLQYNATVNGYAVCPMSGGNDFFPALAPCYVSFDRLVVTESYNSGVSWTTPQVVVAVNNSALNATAPIPAQPAIASYGNTVYLAWTNFTFPDFEDYYAYPPPAPSVGLNLVVSTNGGASWGSSIQLPVIVGSGSYSGAAPYVAYAPALAVNSKGYLSVAYDTNFTEQTGSICQPTGCGGLYYGPEATLSVVVATSKNNGTTFKLATVDNEVPGYWNADDTWISGGAGSLIAPEPAIAVNPTNNHLYVTYTGGGIGTVCDIYGCSTGVEDFENLWESSSTNGGANWTAPAALGDTVLGINGSATSGNFLFTPSIGVGASGDVYISAQLANDSVCFSYYCGQYGNLVLESTNNGSSWLPPVYPTGSAGSYAPVPFSDGIDTSLTIYNGSPYIAWTQYSCANATLPSTCAYLGSAGNEQVVISGISFGTGLTVTFNETGLPPGYNWSISLSGNVRAGAAGTNLSVSGVPSGRSETWTILPVATSIYGIQFNGVATVLSPGSFSANAVLNVTFTESALVNVNTVPSGSANYPFYCGGTSGTNNYQCGNENVTPMSGSTWVTVGTPFSYGVYDGGFPAGYCGSCYNYTFQAWSGSGNGSWNSTVSNGTTTIYGPVNETASFTVASVCFSLPFYTCFGLVYQYNFTEIGLPTGTNWTMSFGNASNTTTHSSTGSYITFWNGVGPYSYTIDTLPVNATYCYVGVANVPSPLGASQGDVTIRFALVADSAIEFPVNFTETGAPASASGWGLSLGSTTYGVPLTGETIPLSGGLPGVTLNATSVYGNNGVEGTISSFDVTPDTVGATPYTLSVGGTLVLQGPATVTAVYASSYWLEIPTPTNGTVNQTSQWVASGDHVEISAAPSAGYSFVGWTGTGTGSKTATTLTITVSPGSPVTEVATFAPLATAYTVTVDASGLPAGALVTFDLGPVAYTGAAPITISGVAPGSYEIAAPAVEVNGTPGEQFEVSGITSSLPMTDGLLTVSGDGSVSLTYVADYQLTITPTTNGTVSPTAGNYWETGGSAVTITATAAVGFVFAGWVGTGPGSYTGPLASTTVTPTGPVSESASFAVYVAPVHEYTLSLVPVGLPSGVAWSASIGTTGVSGTGTLTFSLENGTYSVSVGTLSPSAGVEYIPSQTSFSVTVAGVTPYAGPTFATWYLLTITGTGGGTTGPTTAWEAAGTTVTLSVLAASGSQFVNWTGSGTGSYTGASGSSTVTMNGPVSELATFVPSSSLVKTSSSGGSDVLAIALLVVLLIVGLVVGLLVARSRPPSGGASSAPEATEADTSSVPVWTESAETTEVPPVSPPSDGTEEESIYGGGPG